MALLSATLSTQLQNIGFPSTHAAAGQAWADAYEAYAAAAQSPLGAVGSLAAAKATLAAVLGPAFASQTPATVLSGIANGLTAFWLTPPVVFAGAPPGAVTVVGGTAALPAALSAVFANNIASKASKPAACDAIATALHTFTLTVIVTHPVVPTPVVGPIF